MIIPSPFALDAASGALTIGSLHATLTAHMLITEFQATNLYGFMSAVTMPSHGIAYQTKTPILADRTWLYLTACFDDDRLRVVGCGWGMLRDKWGFYEQTSREFQEQLTSYVEWLKLEIGPSQPVSAEQAYRKTLQWGEIYVCVDARTNLPGVHLEFKG